jgi:hypothetical protein
MENDATASNPIQIAVESQPISKKRARKWEKKWILVPNVF